MTVKPLGVVLITLALITGGCTNGENGAQDEPVDPMRSPTADVSEPSPSDAVPTDGDRDGDGPPGAAPSVPGVTHSPPPAWIGTSEADVWLAHGSYCWETQCADPRPVETRDDIPRIELTAGEIVEFHLDFQPETLTLDVGGERHELDAGEVATWEVSGTGGLLTLKARVEGDRAEYLAEVVVR